MSLTDALLLDPYPFETWIAKRADGLVGTGTIADPLSASSSAVLDAILNNLQPGTVVHLGPGVFETQGYYDGGAFSGYGWQAKGRTRIIGSGSGVTTLKMVISGTPPADSHFYAIGHALTTDEEGPANLVDFLEISDLTVDCQAASQPTATHVRCGAIRVMGSHVRVTRVTVVNWGGSPGSTKSTFAIAIVTAHPDAGVSGVDNAGMEDCVAIQPATSGPAIALHAGPKEDLDGSGMSSRESFGQRPFIRNCLVDFATESTPFAGDYDHTGLSMGWCLGGVLTGNQVYNVKYGCELLQRGSVRDLVIRNSFFKNVYKAVVFRPALKFLGSGTLSQTGAVATATMGSDHYLAIGDRVAVTDDDANTHIREVTAVTHNTFNFNNSVSMTSPITAAKVFGSGKSLVECNAMELKPETSGEQICVHLDDGAIAQDATYPAYVHGESIVSENHLRYVDGQFDGSFTGYATQGTGVQALIVRDQVLELAPVNPLRNSGCQDVTYFNNKTPSGALVQGVNEDLSNHKYDELATLAEDAFVLAFMNRK